jgi:hypothetical protein
MALHERSGEYGMEFASRRAISPRTIGLWLFHGQMLAMQVDSEAILRKMQAGASKGICGELCNGAFGNEYSAHGGWRER